MNELNYIYLIEIDNFLQFQEQIQKKSFNKKDLEKVTAVLPALHNPTISSLSDGNWFAVETILRINDVKKIIPRLKRAGAIGIVEYPVKS